MTTPPSRSAHAFIFLTVAIDVIGFGIVIPVMPQLLAEVTGKGLADAAMAGGVLLFVYALMQFLFAPVMGALSDAVGRRRVLVLSLLALGLDYLVMALAPSFAILVLGRMIAGIFGATHTTAHAFIADTTPPDRRAGAFGMLGAAFGLGFVLGPAIGGLLGEIGSRVPFLAAAGLALANAAFGAFVLPETLAREHRRPFTLAGAGMLGAFGRLARFPALASFFGVLICYQLAHDANPSTWTYYTMLRFGWSQAEVGLSLAIVGVLTALVMGVFTPWLVPRIGERRAVILGLTGAAIGFAGYAFAGHGAVMLAFILPFSALGLAMPSLRAIMTREVPSNRQGELSGAVTSVISLTMIISPLMMSRLFGYFSGPEAPISFPGAAFAAASLLMLAALALFIAATRGRKAPGERP